MRRGWIGRARSVGLTLLVALMPLIEAPPVGGSWTGAPGVAPTGAWSQIGPEGAMVTALAINPTNSAVMYAGVRPDEPARFFPQVYRSADGGQSWVPGGTGLPNDVFFQISNLIVAPTAPSTVFLVARQGLFRSQNSGDSWSRIDSGLVADRVISVAVDPSNHATLYVGTDQAILKSVDAGTTWTPANTGLPPGRVTKLVVAPSSPSLVYALVSSRIYRSTDGGATWQSGTPLPNSSWLTDFDVDAASATTLYARTFNDGMFRSPDSGVTWQPISSGLATAHVVALGVDSSQGGVLYAATSETFDLTPAVKGTAPFFKLHRSSDGGTTWTSVYDGLTIPQVMAVRGGSAYLGTGHGVYRSPDGTIWTLSNRGLPRLPIISMLVGAPNGTILAGARGGGVWRSLDRGETWTFPNGSMRATNPLGLAQDPSNPSILYATTWRQGQQNSESHYGIHKSIDGGSSWESLVTGIQYGTFVTAPNLVDIQVHPDDPDLLYAAGSFSYNSGPGAGAQVGVLQVSTDGGRTWEARETNLRGGSTVTGVALPAGSTSVAYAAAGEQFNPVDFGTAPGGVYKTTNQGYFWQPSDRSTRIRGARSLVVDPTAPQTLYAGTVGARVRKTTDGGETWADAGAGLPDVAMNVLVLDPTAPRTIYVGTTDQGIYKSRNGGWDWAVVVAGGTPMSVRRLAVDPTRPSVLYAIDGDRLVVLDQALVPPTPTTTLTPTVTLTPTSTSTPTLTPTSTQTQVPVACAPRPNVGVETTQTGPGTLTTRVSLNTAPGTPTNGFERISFDGGDNATVEVLGQPPRPPGFVYAPPAGATATFVVRRVAAGPFQVRLTVVDSCGPWPSFVGGGPDVP